MIYFKNLVTGKKKAIMKDSFRSIEMNRYPELSNDFALEQAKKDPEIFVYIPDHWFRAKKKVDRQFLWGMLHTVRTDYVT